MTKRYRVVWVDTNVTLMIVEDMENERQAIARALRNTEVLDHEVRAYEVGPDAA